MTRVPVWWFGCRFGDSGAGLVVRVSVCCTSAPPPPGGGQGLRALLRLTTVLLNDTHKFRHVVFYYVYFTNSLKSFFVVVSHFVVINIWSELVRVWWYFGTRVSVW